MKRIVFFVCLVIPFLLPSLEAQKKELCGTHDHKYIFERLEENKIRVDQGLEFRTDEIYFVPLKFHIVTKDDGSGSIKHERILKQLSRLNSDYAPLNMRFYFDGSFNEINYSTLYENPHLGASTGVMKGQKDNSALNIYIVNNISESDDGQTLGYYDPYGSRDWIVVVMDKVGSNSQTLSHEIGHFFSMPHTFYGWESDPYDGAIHGNPVNILETSFGVKIEFMDGSNCHIAADKICDTPPDYNFGLGDPEGNCKLDYTVLDYNGDEVIPMEHNFMGYFFGCGSYEFTEDQMALMRADFESSDRGYIRTGYIPDTTIFEEEAPVITKPENASTTEFYNYVEVEWTPVEGANNYLVKVTDIVENKIVYYHVKNDNKVILTHLEPNEPQIYVDVYPYNEGRTKGMVKSASVAFKTSDKVDVDDVKLEDLFKIYPTYLKNPESTIYLRSAKSISNCIFELYDLNGQKAFGHSMNLEKGLNELSLTTEGMHTGMYLATLRYKGHTYSEKLIITK